MGSGAFWGGFLAVAAAIGILAFILHQKWKRFRSRYAGAARILSAAAEMEREEPPRSVNGCDRFVIPRILEDFPDFDPESARSAARDYLESRLSGRQDLQIHQIVYSRYLPTGARKTVVFQASAGWRENGETVQKRYDLSYAYRTDTGDAVVAANCPNCGGNLGYGDRECPYCGSRVVAVMHETWEFTRMTES